ncbi:hypothetical protein OQA88_1352 [Cercophora sp. LCS_1]
MPKIVRPTADDIKQCLALIEGLDFPDSPRTVEIFRDLITEPRFSSVHPSAAKACVENNIAVTFRFLLHFKRFKGTDIFLRMAQEELSCFVKTAANFETLEMTCLQAQTRHKERFGEAAHNNAHTKLVDDWAALLAEKPRPDTPTRLTNSQLSRLPSLRDSWRLKMKNGSLLDAGQNVPTPEPATGLAKAPEPGASPNGDSSAGGDVVVYVESRFIPTRPAMADNNGKKRRLASLTRLVGDPQRDEASRPGLGDGTQPAKQARTSNGVLTPTSSQHSLVESQGLFDPRFADLDSRINEVQLAVLQNILTTDKLTGETRVVPNLLAQVGVPTRRLETQAADMTGLGDQLERATRQGAEFWDALRNKDQQIGSLINDVAGLSRLVADMRARLPPTPGNKATQWAPPHQPPQYGFNGGGFSSPLRGPSGDPRGGRFWGGQ